MEEGNEKDEELIAESARVTVRDGQEYMTSGALILIFFCMSTNHRRWSNLKVKKTGALGPNYS